MHKRLPSLDLLRGFEAAARHLSFTRASAELFVTQSAVSRQIKTLEEHLGVALFRRGNRELFLTDSGQVLFKALRDALPQIEAAVARIGGMADGRPLTVTASVSFSALWLVPRLPEFRRGHPEIDVRIAADNRVLDLERAGIDLAIRYDRQTAMPPEAELLFGETVFPVCSPALARDRSRPLKKPADLARHVLLHLDGAASQWPWLNWNEWLEALGLRDLRPAGVMRFSHYDQLIQAAIEGEGVALGRDPLIRQAMARKQLVAPFSTRSVSPRAYFLLRAKGAARPEVEAFAAWLKAAAGS
ncbi:MAG: transcriptional regulator GcvA [Pseudomonadota bacterium]